MVISNLYENSKFEDNDVILWKFMDDHVQPSDLLLEIWEPQQYFEKVYLNLKYELEHIVI